jgi:hypothetical protein
MSHALLSLDLSLTDPGSEIPPSANPESPSVLNAVKAAGHAFVRAAKAVRRKRVLWAAMAAGAVLGVPHAAKAQNTFPSSGNVGIGTSSPQHSLDVYGTSYFTNSTYPVLQAQRTTSATNAQVTTVGIAANTSGTAADGFGPDLTFSIGTSDGVSHCLWNLSAIRAGGDNQGDLIFQAANPEYVCGGNYNERMRILNNGKVGIGTTAPTEVLDVTGAVKASGTDSSNETSAAVLGYFSGISRIVTWGGTSNTVGAFEVNAVSSDGSINTAPFFINTAGSVGIGTTSPSYLLQVNGSVGASSYSNLSDARLKKDITPLAYGLTAVMKLRPVGFNWKDQDQKWKKRHQIGLIAQEVEMVVPEVVTTADDQMQTKSIAYGSLVPVLIQALQEEQQEITQLKQVVCQSKTAAKSTSVCSRPSPPAGAKAAAIRMVP